jgi:methionyl-tRNA synthetase
MGSALKPFMVDTPAKIGRQIGSERIVETADWNDLKEWGLLESGIKVKKGDPIFPRIDIEEYFEGVENKMENNETNEEVETVEEKNLISFDDFTDLDLRVAEVLEAEKIEGSNKLLKVKLDIGDEKRQVVAGIARHYEAEEIIGKKVIMVANLEPATIFGVKSNGMVLAASNDEKLTLATVEGDISSGSSVN